MNKLLVLPSTAVAPSSGGVLLDTKFVEGMRAYCDLWHGSVSALLYESTGPIPFGREYRLDELPFELVRKQPSMPIVAADLLGFTTVLGSGDSHSQLGLPDLLAGTGTRLFYTIEYIPETRRQIIMLDRTRSLPRKAYSLLWNRRQEGLRRRAFRRAAGLQANGYPAHALYRQINADTMLYLDNRMKPALFATAAELEAKCHSISSGAPLRLMYSGRLETMKGAQDLIPLAEALRRRGMRFQLAIYGAGSLEQEIRNGIRDRSLGAHVSLHAPVDFETELVPLARRTADVFVSCHRQSDPSCSYLENMGCGLPIVGYANRMLQSLIAESDAGWTVRLGDTDALASALLAADQNRQSIIDKLRRAHEFSRQRDFLCEFGKRVQQMQPGA